MTSSIRQPRPRKQSSAAIPKKCMAVKTFDVFEEVFADEFVDHTPWAKHHVWKFVRRSTMAVRAGSANQFLNK